MLRFLIPGSLMLLAFVIGAPPDVSARGRGTVLPELSGGDRGPTARARPYREVRKRRERRLPSERLKDGTLRFRAPGWLADVKPDGSVRFHPRRASWRASQTSLSFDVTDATMRGRGKHPYAMEKLRFLRDTRLFRARLRRRARLRWRRAYFARLPRRLRDLWARRDRTPAQKRKLLYQLWEECLEPGDSPLRQRAQQARWTLLRFIQRHLPRGSALAYTPAELRQLAAERRRQPAFRPYQPLRRPLPPGVPRARPPAKKRRPQGAR